MLLFSYIRGKNMKKMKYLLLIFAIFLLVGCDDNNKDKDKDKENIPDQTENAKGDYELNQEFSFMSFQITIKDVEDIVTINKELSSDDGKKVIKVPIKVKNVGSSNDHLSMFYYKLYDTKGNELSSKGSHFDDSIDFAKDLKPKEEYTKYLYIPYEGKGNYQIVFNNFSNKYKIYIKVNK
jgi:hypothetical protein